VEETKIEWTDNTLNFWHGCTKVTEGCKFCYMYSDKERYGQAADVVIRSKDDIFYKALKWKEAKKVFTCSWSDFFIKEADEWRADAYDVIRKTPQHSWQILTKRANRVVECLPDDWGQGYDNVWLGVSIENQRNAYRLEQLKAIPARTKFLSIEPLIGPIKGLDYSGIDWVIIGGESGARMNIGGTIKKVGKRNQKIGGQWIDQFRPCKMEWIEGIVEDVQKYDVPIFIKQFGTTLAKGRKMSGTKGGKIEEFPEHLQLREYPGEKISVVSPYTLVQRLKDCSEGNGMGNALYMANLSDSYWMDQKEFDSKTKGLRRLSWPEIGDLVVFRGAETHAGVVMDKSSSTSIEYYDIGHRENGSVKVGDLYELIARFYDSKVEFLETPKVLS
jgi:protein gp37